MIPLVLVHGTWGRADPWHLAGSELRGEAEAHGLAVHDFLWSGILGGVIMPGIWPPEDPHERWSTPRLAPWLEAGEKLGLFCRLRGLERPHVLSHSHGLQVVAYAAAKGQAFDTWISVAGPVRRDMQRVRRAARPNVRRWIQFVDPLDDQVIREGELFDGELDCRTYAIPEADGTVLTPASGHSGIVGSASARSSADLWGYLLGLRDDFSDVPSAESTPPAVFGDVQGV